MASNFYAVNSTAGGYNPSAAFQDDYSEYDISSGVGRASTQALGFDMAVVLDVNNQESRRNFEPKFKQSQNSDGSYRIYCFRWTPLYTLILAAILIACAVCGAAIWLIAKLNL